MEQHKCDEANDLTVVTESLTDAHREASPSGSDDIPHAPSNHKFCIGSFRQRQQYKRHLKKQKGNEGTRGSNIQSRLPAYLQAPRYARYTREALRSGCKACGITQFNKSQADLTRAVEAYDAGNPKGLKFESHMTRKDQTALSRD